MIFAHFFTVSLSFGHAKSNLIVLGNRNLYLLNGKSIRITGQELGKCEFQKDHFEAFLTLNNKILSFP